MKQEYKSVSNGINKPVKPVIQGQLFSYIYIAAHMCTQILHNI